MSLHELDSNANANANANANTDAYTPRSLSHSKRDSLQSNFSLTSKKDEVATPRTLSAKHTPPSERLLAPTHSSAAKANPTSIHRKPLPAPLDSPSSRASSRAGSNPSGGSPSPTTSKWASRVAHRVAVSEQNNLHTQRVAAEYKKQRRLPSLVSTTNILMAQSGTPSPSESLGKDKPLPSRPVASVVSTVSPSKHGRSLIDASEQPLQFSINGNRHDWPALTPRSVSAPEPGKTAVNAKKATPSSIPRKVSGTPNITSTPTYRASRISGMRPSLTARNSRASALTQRSSDHSFVSAEESADDSSKKEQLLRSDDEGKEQSDEGDRSEKPNEMDPLDNASTSAFPTRKQSLPHTTAVELPAVEAQVEVQTSLLEAPQRSASTPQQGSRNDSPSEANFSRPRPDSSQFLRLPSLSKSITTPTSVKSTHHQRTASRIPIADGKKATLVDVTSQNAPRQPVTATIENSPSFGARRLVSPNALAILDQGTKRRLQRANTDCSTASTTSSSTRVLNLDDPPANSLEHTSGPSSSDDDEVTTPTQAHSPFSGLVKKPSREFGLVHESEFESGQLDVPRLRRAPPTKSRFAGPLQTIHSQSVLPTYPDHSQKADRDTTSPPMRASGVAKGLSDLRNAHSIFSKKQNRQANTVLDNAQAPLKGLPGVAEAEEGGSHGRGKSEHDIDKHLDRTLSILEGQGTPPDAAIDNDKLQEMFGFLKKGVGKASKSNSLVANAAAADMFLGQAALMQPDVQHATSRDREVSQPTGEEDGLGDRVDAAAQSKAASKWSNSTPSAPPNSTELPRSDPSRSIGYPSAVRIPSIATSELFNKSTKNDADGTSRNSSPTLGFGKRVLEKTQGSVKHARESIPARGNFARMTAASASKKNGRTLASTTRSVRKPEDLQRGRASLLGPSRIKASPGNAIDKTSSRAPHPHNNQTPRSRSKSRTVLDKINGFFGHKRDKKSQLSGPPPVPVIGRDSTADIGKESTIGTTDDNTAEATEKKATPTTPLIASTFSAPELRSSSRATDMSDTSLSSDLLMDGDVGGNVLTLTEKLVSKAKLQVSAKRKERMLNFAMVLNDAMLNVREAQISAETARQMAERAELSYRKTKKGVDMLQRLASSLVQSTVRH